MSGAPRRRAEVVAAGAATLSIEVVGEGVPVVLTHGLGGNHASWFQQLLPFTAAGYQVVTWDQRGFGNSTRGDGPFGPGPAVGDLALVADALGLARFHLVGQSMGGWVAMGYALAHPGRLASLTLTDTLAGVFTPEVLAALRPPEGAPMRRDQVGAHPALGEPFRTARPDLAVLYEELSGFGDKPPDDEVLALLGTTRFDPAAVRGLSMPVQLVVGALDQLCPPAAMAAIAALIPGSRLEVIEGCGHSPYFEDPAAWNRAVLGFLDLAGDGTSGPGEQDLRP